MRRFHFHRWRWLALAALSMLMSAAGGARAASVQEVLEKYNLLGTWAWDCSKPADAKSNWVFVNRMVDANHMQRDFMKNATERAWYSVVTEATAIGPTELRVAGTRDGQRTDAIWRVEGTRMIQWEASQGGKKIIANGRYVSGNSAEVPALNKCGAPAKRGAAPANTQVASASTTATRATAPGRAASAASARSGLKTQIATHMSYDRQCKPYRVVVNLLSQPANGTVTVEAKNIVVPPETPRGGTQTRRCVGKTMPGLAVFYQSRLGFVGQDSFTYRRSTPDRPDDRSAGDVGYTVAVQ